MATVHAGQLVFTQATEEESPQGRRGEQTVYCSRRTGPFSASLPRICLERAEEVEIEKRLFYHPPSDNPAKHVFFSTKTGKVVVGKVVARIGETDSAGRAGLYFGHALVFDREAFLRDLAGNPFEVFDTFSFWTKLADVPAERRDRATGDLAPAEIPVRVGPPALAMLRQVDSALLRKLLLLGASADDMTRDGEVVVWRGTTGEILALLRDLFDCQPALLRLTCSFDTLFCGGSLNHLTYWGIGLPSGDESAPPGAPSFDVKNRRFERPFEPQPRRGYERWLDQVMAKGARLDRIARDHAKSFDLARRFDRLAEAGIDKVAAPPSDAPLDTRLIREYLLVNQETVKHRLLKLLAGRIGAPLAKRLLPRLMAHKQFRDPGVQLRLLERGVSSSNLLYLLDSQFKRPTAPPPVPYLAAIRTFLKSLDKEQAASDYAVRLELITLRWRRHWRKLAAALFQAPPAASAWFQTWALATLGRAVHWRLCRWDHGLAFGGYVRCQNAADLPLLDVLLGLRRRASASEADGAASAVPDAPPPATEVIQLDFGPSRRPWLLELVTLGADGKLPVPEMPEALALAFAKRLDECLQLLKGCHWPELRLRLLKADDDLARAFVNEALEYLSPPQPCILHEENAVFVGVWIPVPRKDEHHFLGLLSALLNWPDDLRPLERQASSAAPWWQRLVARFQKQGESSALALPIPGDADADTAAISQWPKWLERLHKGTKHEKAVPDQGSLGGRVREEGKAAASG